MMVLVGVGFPGLNSDTISDWEIPLPPRQIGFVSLKQDKHEPEGFLRNQSRVTKLHFHLN